jgi:hypothetical protein
MSNQEKIINPSSVDLPGLFPFGDGRRAPARLKANYWSSRTFLPGASQTC